MLGATIGCKNVLTPSIVWAFTVSTKVVGNLAKATVPEFKFVAFKSVKLDPFPTIG